MNVQEHETYSLSLVDGQEYKPFLLEIASEVEKLLAQKANRKRFEQYSRLFHKKWMVYKDAFDHWQQKIAEYRKKSCKDKRLRDIKAGPPENDLVWYDDSLCQNGDPNFGFWGPPCEKPHPDPMLRLIPIPDGIPPRDHKEALEKYYVLLTIIHDWMLPSCVQIDNDARPKHLGRCGHIIDLNLADERKSIIEIALEHVKADLKEIEGNTEFMSNEIDLMGQIAQRLEECVKDKPDVNILPMYKTLSDTGYWYWIFEATRGFDKVLLWLQWNKPQIAKDIESDYENLKKLAESAGNMEQQQSKSFLTSSADEDDSFLSFQKAKMEVVNLAKKLRHIAEMAREQLAAEKPTGIKQNIKPTEKPKAEDWGQIAIEVVDNDTIKYKVNNKKWERANYTQLGFLDKRKNRANKLWPIFLGLASKNLLSNINRPIMKPKDIDRIRYTLRKFFGIKNLPIKYNGRAKEYRCNFKFNDPRGWTSTTQKENLVD